MSDVKAESPSSASSSSPSSSPSAAPATPTTPKLEGDSLLEALRLQLEFYFSKQNLSTDSYLLSQMNQHPNKSVPVDIICGFKRIKALTDNKTVVVAAMKNCKNIVLDESAGTVRSNIKVERTTLILRDIPADATEAELRAAFEQRTPASPAVGHIVSLTPDINETWFVNFDSEKTCMDVMADIQNNAFTDGAYSFRSKPLSARVKNESLNRSFYNGPPPPVHVAGGSVMVGGPVSSYPPSHPHNPYQPQPYYYSHVYPNGYNNMHTGYMQMGANANAVKGDKKMQPNQQQGQKKEGKKAKKDQTAQQQSPQSQSTPQPSADASAAAQPKAKKNKKKGGADVGVSSVLIPPVALAAAVANVSTADPTVVSDDKAGSIAQLYGHTPRLYSREQIASVVQKFIDAAKANSALIKRPDAFNQCHDFDKVIIKDKPSNAFSILDPFPVIYPASPSPLLAAQPHHSSSLPFLELGGGALDAPYFSADQGFNGSNGHAQRRKSKSGEPGKKNTQNNAATVNNAKPRGNASPKPRQPSPPQHSQPQPKIIPPPPVQPASASSAATSTTTPPATSPVPAATSSTPSKPTSFAAAALAAANQPMQPQPRSKPAPKPAATAAPVAAANADKKESGAKKEKKEKAKKEKANNAPKDVSASSTSTASPAVSQPAQPSVPNYASRVGVAADKALAQKQAKEAADRERAKQEAIKAKQTDDKSKPKEQKKDKKKEDNKEKEADKEKDSSAATATSSSDAAKSATDSAAKPFSYAAMIKKAPAASSASAAPAKSTSPAASAPASSSSAAPAKSSEASSWRSQ